MALKKKLKLKAPIISFLKIIGIVLGIILAIFIFYSYQISTLTNIGYSKEASKFILFNNLKKHVMTLGKNETLNAAFESEYYEEKNLDNYQNIHYVKQDNFIKNVNALISKGYTDSDINLIFSRGNSKDVEEFAKRDKVRYLEEFYSIPYAKLKYYDRYIAYSDETGEDDSTTVLVVNLDLDKEDYADPIEIKEFSKEMLVNKHRKLSENFEPDDLITIDSNYAASDDLQASKLAVDAFIEMAKDAKKEGYGILINSAYRSYKDQEEICNTYRGLYGDSYVERYVALPGFSEHQTGLAFDIASTSSNIFANSKEYQWMLDNAYKYGFILRFPSKYTSITGFRSEPWHYRYVGKKISKVIQEEKISFEEYFALYLDK